MTKLMIVVASVREGRIGLPIADWVRDTVERDGRFELDWADLKEIGLPLMSEPNHPRLRQYTQPSTIAWSERVDAADAFIFVQPEYNYSYPPSLKNALDHLSQEWWRKPLGTVSYGGISGGTRSVTALRVPETALGLVPTTANVEIPWAAKQIDDDGLFEANEHQERMLATQLDELLALAGALAPLRANRR
ncbi:NADPH-dependent FMN reductase [Humibacter ginsenosidimutans]|uniref:NAD(P)H-dependent oxidoreductase n=1 Tax=Humibacter ginsenosidimutans TaxID=2599293 RepID=A0A5B8M4H3_9MICO|nr:NAD(P)H-dependent oxidoreductase [Humibacter ginsenosidimutans]QDZ14582.1 NAD(P)H-dependent oxidoreductase [Humibacter ginsenosidimutans]